MRLLIILCLFLSSTAAARSNQPYPPELTQLGRQLNLAESRLQTLQRHLARQHKLHATETTRLQNLTTLLLRAQKFPPSFWQANAILTNQPQQASLLPMALRQGTQQTTQLHQRLSILSTLHQQANQQADALRGLQASFSTAQGKLSQSQATSLQHARLQAESLATTLQQALNNPQPPAPLNFTTSISPTESPPPSSLTLSPTLPIQGKVLHGFHQTQGATAEGITLQGQAGSPIQAQSAGEVLYSGPFRQFGGLIIIKANSGHDILYGGLQTLTVNPGDTVIPGQTLGTLTPTGKLYWEIRRRGRPLNPLALKN